MRIAFHRQQRAAVTRHLGDFASAIGKTERALGAAQVGQASAAEADLDLASLRSEIGRQPHITFALFPSEPSPARKVAGILPAACQRAFETVRLIEIDLTAFQRDEAAFQQRQTPAFAQQRRANAFTRRPISTQRQFSHLAQADNQENTPLPVHSFERTRLCRHLGKWKTCRHFGNILSKPPIVRQYCRPRDSLAIFVQRVRRVRVDCDYSYSTIRVSLVLSSADTKNPNRENIQRHQRSLPTPPVQLASPTCEAHPTGGSWKLIWGQFTIELPPVICYTGAC